MTTSAFTIDDYMDIVTFTNPNDYEKYAYACLELFNYTLEHQNELGYYPNVAFIKTCITKMLTMPGLKPYVDDSVLELCNAIAQKTGQPIPDCVGGPGKRIPVNRATRKIGKGSYGCAMSPALPNRGANGAWVQYPSNVTKVFFEKKDKNKIMQKQPIIQSLFQNNGHRINEYAFKNYKGYHLPLTLRNNCNISDNQELNAVRMPNLGVSIADSSAVRAQLQALPIRTLLEQIRKLFVQLQNLQAGSYIHGDIRETNIMIHPDTGAMTIIDFDWLLQKHEFFADYFEYLGFYNNPPEVFLLKDPDMSFGQTTDAVLKNALSKMPELATYYKYHQVYKSFVKKTLAPDELLNAIVETRNRVKANNPPSNNPLSMATALMESTARTFDSFGLANSLLVLLMKTQRTDDVLRSLVFDILVPMTDLVQEKRMDVYAAVPKLDVLIASLPVPGGRRRHRKTLRRRRSN